MYKYEKSDKMTKVLGRFIACGVLASSLGTVAYAGAEPYTPSITKGKKAPPSKSGNAGTPTQSS